MYCFYIKENNLITKCINGIPVDDWYYAIYEKAANVIILKT